MSGCCASCNCDPCGCGDPGRCAVDPCAPVNPGWPQCPTKCNGDTRDNIWMVSDQPGYDCKCKLDVMTYEQVIEVLERVPYANVQLAKITDDECLLRLAREIKLRIPVQEDNQIAVSRLTKNTLPFYTLFRGNTGGDAGRRRRG